jgi:hypothetical protein
MVVRSMDSEADLTSLQGATKMTTNQNDSSMYCCASVVGGWQTENKLTGERFGPVFNCVTDLWEWQGTKWYEPPTVEEWHEIVKAMKYYGLDTHLEGGGAAATYVWIDRLDGRVVLVGDQDETWCGNVYASQEAFENGEEFTTFGTDVPTKFDGTDRFHDPESIAEAVFTALRSC